MENKKSKKGLYVFVGILLGIVICGGAEKGVSFEPLTEALIKYAKAVVFTGECKEKMISSLYSATRKKSEENNKITGKSKTNNLDSSLNTETYIPKVYVKDIFEEAVCTAIDISDPGDKIVLSPAATSFDCFKNYIERAEVFKNTVLEYAAKSCKNSK